MGACFNFVVALLAVDVISGFFAAIPMLKLSEGWLRKNRDFLLCSVALVPLISDLVLRVAPIRRESNPTEVCRVLQIPQ